MDQPEPFTAETAPQETASSALKPHPQYLRDYLVLFMVAGLIVFLDQWSKDWVVANIPFGGSWLPEKLAWLEPYARLVHWRNTGAAFGAFQEGNQVFKILAAIVSVFIIAYYPHVENKEWPLKVALLLELAGAVGNLVSRFRFDHVIDFISVGNFAVFNVADSAITVGASVLVLSIIWHEYKEWRKPKGEFQEQNESINEQ